MKNLGRQIQSKDINTIDLPNNQIRSRWVTDCLSTAASGISPFVGAAISSGTLVGANVGLADITNHPGVVKMRSSTTANSGYRIQSDAALLLKPGYRFTAIFNITTIAGSTFRIGLHDSVSSADAVDGAYFEIVAGLVTAKTANNGIRTVGANSLNLLANTWYLAKIEYLPTGVQFDIFASPGSTSLVSNLITTNIPVTAGRECAAGIVATNSGTTAIDLFHLDYMEFFSIVNR